MYISNLHQTCYTVLVNILVLVTMQGHLLLLLSHVVIVVNQCCVEGLMEDKCISNKHSR